MTKSTKPLMRISHHLPGLEKRSFKKIQQSDNSLKFLIHTTRNLRPNEVDGVIIL